MINNDNASDNDSQDNSNQQLMKKKKIISNKLKHGSKYTYMFIYTHIYISLCL